MSGGATVNDILFGDAGNDTLNGGTGSDTMRGGLGSDTYSVDAVGDIVIENAGEGGDTVKSSITHVLAANVENLSLMGINTINGTGNVLDNVLTGNVANNTLNGMGGNDTMTGGAGNDTYVVDSALDIVVENSGEGSDLIQVAVSYTLSANVENLTLTGAGHINASGNALANTLRGNTGNNVLDGAAGADKMTGGMGNDTYVVDNALDVVTELVGGGTDTVQSNLSYTLGTNVEALILTGSAAVNATGNTLGNTLTGNSTANILNGGTGADRMAGGEGNDTYVVDNIGDIVTESAGGGADTVRSTVTHTLATEVENLVLLGSSMVNGTGNPLDNFLTGNTGSNILDGGVGADTMSGGSGNDTYIIDNIGDIVTENAGAGTDTVRSGLSYTLGSNIENLVLTGTAAINGTGNTVANILTGNSGNNILNGGMGADRMSGGAGNDIYIVDSSGDTIAELAGGGTDLVNSSISHILSTNIEKLTLAGAGNINGTGNVLANVLTGNSGNNTLNGGSGNDTLYGGTGADILMGGLSDDILYGQDDVDTLSGGTGSDRFVFESASAFTGIDKVSDFKLAEGDMIDISDVLDGYDSMTDLLSDFVEITNSGANSVLKVDRDGAGTAYGFTQIATLNGISNLTDEDALVASGNLIVS